MHRWGANMMSRQAHQQARQADGRVWGQETGTESLASRFARHHRMHRPKIIPGDCKAASLM